MEFEFWGNLNKVSRDLETSSKRDQKTSNLDTDSFRRNQPSKDLVEKSYLDQGFVRPLDAQIRSSTSEQDLRFTSGHHQSSQLIFQDSELRYDTTDSHHWQVASELGYNCSNANFYTTAQENSCEEDQGSVTGFLSTDRNAQGGTRFPLDPWKPVVYRHGPFRANETLEAGSFSTLASWDGPRSPAWLEDAWVDDIVDYFTPLLIAEATKRTLPTA